jgi:transcriptional regulator with XRE-family HTH domain
MTIGDRIRHYRLKLGWKLDHLSDLSGVKTGTISALEQRSSNKSEHFAAIAKAFGLTLEQLADTTVDWDVADSATGVTPAVLVDIEQASPDLHRVEEPAASFGPRTYSRQALELAREYDAIRSKKWQKTAYAYCQMIMNRDPLMMAWLDSLTKVPAVRAGAPATRALSEDP